MHSPSHAVQLWSSYFDTPEEGLESSILLIVRSVSWSQFSLRYPFTKCFPLFIINKLFRLLLVLMTFWFKVSVFFFFCFIFFLLHIYRYLSFLLTKCDSIFFRSSFSCFYWMHSQIFELIGTGWFSGITTFNRNASKNMVSKSPKQVEATNSGRIGGSQYGKYGACGSTISSCTGTIPWGWQWIRCSTTTINKLGGFILLSTQW